MEMYFKCIRPSIISNYESLKNILFAQKYKPIIDKQIICNDGLREDLLNFQHQIFSFIDSETKLHEFMRIVFHYCSFDFISLNMKSDLPPISNAAELIDSLSSYEKMGFNIIS